MSYALSHKDDLIIKYIPLVKKVVGRIELKDNVIDHDDLFSVGILGLMDAIDRYDNNKNVPFEAYATLRIRGTIIDELRKSGKVSRNKMDKLNEYYIAKENLERSLMRSPNEEEICKELGIDEKQLSKIHETVHYLSWYSLESTMFTKNGDEFSLIDVIRDDKNDSPEDFLIKIEQKKALVGAINKLKEREQIVLSLYYVEELSLKEIAYILDISIPRVSQIHGKILMKLRDLIGGTMEEAYV